jgi:hypothetical protein
VRILPVLVVASCGFRLADANVPSGPPAFDCEQVALQDGLGDPDPCDVQACRKCVDTCGASCEVLESYPPQYSCDGETSWDVYDSCADWRFPEA